MVKRVMYSFLEELSGTKLVHAIHIVFAVLCMGASALFSGKNAREDREKREGINCVAVSRVKKAAQQRQDSHFSSDLRVRLVNKLFLKENKKILGRATQQRHPARHPNTWQRRIDEMRRQSQEIRGLLQAGQQRIQLLNFMIEFNKQIDEVLTETKEPLLIEKTQHHQLMLQMLHKNLSEGKLDIAQGFFMARKLQDSFHEGCNVSAMLPFQELQEALSDMLPSAEESILAMPNASVSWVRW